MCAKSVESNIETRAFALNVYTIYIYPNQTIIRCASYIKYFEKEAYIWVSGFCPRGGIKRNQMLVS
jgi:hypothetical protein